MAESIRRYFIALLPPPAVQAYANTVQQIFVDRYHSQAALKSPPHITIQAPFEWATADLDRLTTALTAFTASRTAVPIELNGFGAFPPRVIYINVCQTPELLALHTALLKHLETNLAIVDPIAKARSFKPHLTVGFRDLSPANFQAAWAEFQSQAVQFQFTVQALTLLIHTGQRWVVQQEFPMLATKLD